MLDIAEELHRWVEQGRDFAVATVVAVGGSAPRQPGAALAVDADGTAIGSVSGGCVEGAVYELCQQALEDGKPVLERFGYSDEDAFAVGLTCGGHHRHPGDAGARPRTRPRGVRVGAVRRRPRGGGGGGAHRLRAGGTAGPRPAGPPRRLVRGRIRRPPRTGPHGRGRGARLPGRGPHRHPGDRRAGLPLRSTAHRSGRVVGPATPDDRLRRDRLRLRPGPHRQVPELPRDGLRRPPGLRDGGPLPGGRRDRRRVAAHATWSARRSTPARSCAS